MTCTATALEVTPATYDELLAAVTSVGHRDLDNLAGIKLRRGELPQMLLRIDEIERIAARPDVQTAVQLARRVEFEVLRRCANARTMMALRDYFDASRTLRLAEGELSSASLWREATARYEKCYENAKAVLEATT